jgi:subtilisin family serine protease
MRIKLPYLLAVSGRLQRLAALAALLLCALGGAPGAFAQTGGPAGGDAPAGGRLVVSFSDKDLTEAQARERLARLGARLERWAPGLGFARVTAPAGRERELAQRLVAQAGIAFAVEERKTASVAAVPRDEHWGEQWGPAQVGLPAARTITRGDPSVVIAILDTGVSYWHWDLREQMWVNPGESDIDPLTGARSCAGWISQNGVDDDGNGYVDDCRGYNFDAHDPDPRDEHGHGTAVAGIAGAGTDNRGSHTDDAYEGIAGMGGASRLMAVRVMDAAGLGWAFDIAEGIAYAADNGAAVINLSLTQPGTAQSPEVIMLCDATSYAIARDVTVVAASGNDYRLSSVSYPARCDGVIAVGASDSNDARASFSNAGEGLDLVAPGVDIFTTLHSDERAYGLFRSGAGTSFAAPHVAGAAALLRAVRPEYTPAQIEQHLRRTAHDAEAPGVDPLTGWGRLDAGRAVELAAMRAYLPLAMTP